ncbi:YfjP family GTPase [Acidipropionibacterium timonense]|uniref:YfjP family GTPase n=1 Tax=Acidipropionibacterium timonense TaxID=2161818 RepID=UPI00102F78D6|nr:YfjP family GTPase [Acidipropionibacterium timonense]
MARGRAPLPERVRSLGEVVDLSEGRVDEDVVVDARAVVERADARLSLSGEHTVVALAGATGSGKSSLFNALAAARLAEPGVTRPTTSRAMAACWGREVPADLLDWLAVPRRHRLDPNGQLDGLVLLDLPDHDSTEVAHRLEVDRLVELVDMFVWVVDPQKYADAALHDGYLRPLATHCEVMTVVLNQVDRLDDAQRRQCLADLRRLLDAEGLRKARIMATSAISGEGVDELRSVLAKAVSSKKALTSRLGADVTATADRLRPLVGDHGTDRVSTRAADRLTAALCTAGGVDVVTQAVVGATRHRGHLATGWPVVSWISRLRPDPLRRLHLDLPARSRRQGAIEPTQVQRTGLPARSGVAGAKVDSALRQIADDAAIGLPRGWADAVRRASLSHRESLADEVDEAISGADLGMSRGTWWWTPWRVLQWLVLAVMVAGLGWLGVDVVLAYLQLPPIPSVHWHRLPLPTILAVGGAAVGLVLGLVGRLLVEMAARVKGARARRILTDVVDEVAGRAVLDPVEDELARHHEAVEVLRRV